MNYNAKFYIMKNLLMCSVLSICCFGIQAQETTTTIETKNEIGIMLTDLLNGAYEFKYERLVGEHFTVGLTAGYKGKEGLFRLSGLDTESIQTGDLTYSGLKIIPEVRYYFNKTQLNSMDGFYVGAYIKHSNFKSDLDGTYTNDLNENFDVEFDAKFNVTSIGFMVGYKYAISKRFKLDFLIAGPGVGFHGYELTQIQALPDEFYDDLNEALSNYSILDVVGSDFQFRASNADTTFSTLAFRYGIALGYSF